VDKYVDGEWLKHVWSGNWSDGVWGDWETLVFDTNYGFTVQMFANLYYRQVGIPKGSDVRLVVSYQQVHSRCMARSQN
jgi:hypothetical protein